jgi:hypothetical protein
VHVFSSIHKIRMTRHFPAKCPHLRLRSIMQARRFA